MTHPIPEWFTASEATTGEVMQRIAGSVCDLHMAQQVRSAPMLAHWFLLDTLLLANQANRDGMHANALALTRQCVEAISVIELGVCGHPEAEAVLVAWDADRLTPGKLRAWLERNAWPHYGSGLWAEQWPAFMREFAGAVQPYAHYGPSLAQWQVCLHRAPQSHSDPLHALIEMKPRAYDPQKATRITLFHAILTFTLGRIWMAANPGDKPFAALVNRLRVALGKSRYLDGHQTDWSQQFWAMMWHRDGGTILEQAFTNPLGTSEFPQWSLSVIGLWGLLLLHHRLRGLKPSRQAPSKGDVVVKIAEAARRVRVMPAGLFRRSLFLARKGDDAKPNGPESLLDINRVGFPMSEAAHRSREITELVD